MIRNGSEFNIVFTTHSGADPAFLRGGGGVTITLCKKLNKFVKNLKILKKRHFSNLMGGCGGSGYLGPPSRSTPAIINFN